MLGVPHRLGAPAPRGRPGQREARGPRDARGGPRGRLQQEARPGLQLLRRRGLQGAGEPREQEVPRRRAQPAVAHRHHRVQAPGRREGLPEPDRRLLRRDARRLVDRAAPRQAPRELEPAQGLRGEAGGRAHDDPLGPGRPLPLAGVDRDLRGERPGQEHVREGLQPGQLGLRGLLRAPQERVLPLQGLGGVSVNLFFTSFAKQAHRSRKGGFTGCANAFSPIPVTA